VEVVNPGALAGASGFHTVMKDDNASERAASLLRQAIDVLQRAENAPDSPVNTFVPGKMRRLLRRGAERLRRGEARPKYRNLFTAEQLADIYQQTILRDEIREQTDAEFVRIGREIARAIEEDGPTVRKTFEAFYLETLRSARENGPDSEAARQLRQLRSLVRFAQRYGADKRRQKLSGSRVRACPHDAEGRIPLIAAEVLASPPSGEAVIAIPPEGSDSGRERIFLRIGVGKGSWIGSFERGHMNVSTIFMMPDAKHLFVSAEGAGYIIDAKSRTLVEEIGTEVAGVMRDDPMTLFIVNHNDRCLEAFDQTGRLWKTGTIGSGGFRRTAITDTSFVGEARQASPPGWVSFSVTLATGEVRFADAL
jgi:AcrR family transcriptional regulator